MDDQIDVLAQPIVESAERFLEETRDYLDEVWSRVAPVPIQLPLASLQDWDKASAIKEWNSELVMRIIRSRTALYGIVQLSDPGRPLYVGQTTSGYGRILEHLYRISPQWRTKALQVHSLAYREKALGVSLLVVPERFSSLVLLMERETIKQRKPAWNADDRSGLDREYLEKRLRFYENELAQLEEEKRERGTILEMKIRGERSDRIKALQGLIGYLKLRSAFG